MIIVNVPICYINGYEKVLQYFVPFLFAFYISAITLPLFISYKNLNYEKKEITKFPIYAFGFKLFLILSSYALQISIQQQRPEPDCVPFFMSMYGFPSVEIVGICALTTTILISYFLYFWYRNKRIYTELPKQSSGKKFISIFFVIFEITSLLFFCFVTPFLFYLFYLNTIFQIIISISIGTIPTIIFWILLINFNESYFI